MRYSLVFLFATLFLSCFSWAQDTSLSGAFDSSIRGNSKWGSSYFSFTTVDAQPLYDGAASANIYNYVGANYKLSRDERINIRPAFSITTAGYNKYGENNKGDVKMNDLYVNYANYGMFLLPGDWDFSGQYRIYFPTSESTQEKKTIAYLDSWMISEKLLGHGWAVQYNMKPRLYIQSQKSYRTESNSGYINSNANQWGKYDHYMKVQKYLNSIFSPALEVGFIHQWYYTSEYAPKSYASRNQLKIAPNTEIHVNRDIWFIAGMENTIDLNDTRLADNQWQDQNGQGINLFRPENTQYYLMTFWSL